MNIVRDCAMCERLWRAYSMATRQHINFEARLKLAVLSRQPDVPTLTHLAEKARDDRVAAQRAVEEHASFAHLDATAP